MKVSHHKRSLRSHHRGSASAVAIFLGLLRVGIPLLLIGGAAFWLLNHSSGAEGQLHVSTSVRGAEILIGGVQTGFQSDTTLFVPVGRKIVTVRKPGFVSIPEFAIVEMTSHARLTANFVMRPARDVAERDSIPPLRPVRQEIFSTGQPVIQIPPAARHGSRRVLDLSPRLTTSAPPPSDALESSNPPPSAPEWQSSPTAETPSSSSSALMSTQVTVSSVPEGALISVNGAPTQHLTPYTFRGLDRGLYSFRVKLEGYLTRPESLAVALNEDFQRELVAFELASDPSLPRPLLTLSTVPLAAGITVDGRAAGVGKVTLDPGFGEHRVEFAEVPGYRTPAPVAIRLTAAEPEGEATGRYERLTGNAFVAIVPNDDVERFDSRLLRVYVDNELVLDNPKERFDATLLGKILSGRRLVRVQYGDLQSDMQVNLLDGEVSEIVFRIESFFSKRRLRLKEKSAVPVEEWRQHSQKLTVLTVSS